MLSPETAAKFIKCIDAQKSLYAGLKPVVSEENKLLAERKIKNLENLIQKQEEIILSIKKFEDEKTEIFKEMAQQAGLKKEEPAKLQDVIEKSGTEGEKIARAVESLIGIVKEIDAINAGNAHLIKEYLGVMDFTSKLRDKINNRTATTYSDSGTVKEAKAEQSKSKFDTKI